MGTTVKIGPNLQDYYSVPGILELDGQTVGECLADLIRRYPDAREWLYDQDGVLQVLISINAEETVVPDGQGLARILKADEELQISAVIGGG
ncbi:MAG: hypothetical protein ABID87_00240 [Chloroflexota bacterium]